MNLRLSDPRGLTEEEAEALIREEKAVFIGFRAQHRAQTHGTFKLLFNSLLG